MKKDPPAKKSKTTSSVKISDLETYSRRQRAYSDSLLLHNLSYAQYNAMPGKRDLREKVSKHIYKPGAEVKERISKGGKVEEHVYKDPDFKLKNGERGIADYWHPEISPTKEYIGYNMDPDNAANMLSTMLVGKDNRKSSMNQLYDKPTQLVVYQPEKKSAPMKKDPPNKKSKTPIYVSDPKDPRIQAYNDSLHARSITDKKLDLIKFLGHEKDPIKTMSIKEYGDYNPVYQLDDLKYKGIESTVGLRQDPSGYVQAFPIFPKPVQPVEYRPEKPVEYIRPKPSYQQIETKSPNLQVQQSNDEILNTIPVQNAITYPKDVRRYTAGQYLESQGKSSGYVNFGKNKGREEMKKYQFGGGLNYTGFTSSFTPSSDPAVADPARYRTSGGQASGSGTGSTLANFGIAAVGAAIKGVETGIGAQASVDAIKKAKTDRSLSKFEQGQKRALELPRTGYYGYGYPKKMQSGGYGNSGGTTYDPALAGMDPDQVERGGQRAITEGTTEAVVSAIPVVGQIIGAATGAVKGVQSAAGKERMMVDGKTIDAYPDSTAAGVGNAMKMFTPHQSGFDHAENKDYGRAVLSWTGLGVIPDMIEGMSDQEDAERERIKNKVTSNVGGTSSASGTTYQRGSHVQMKYGGTSRPNAELEGGEIVEKSSGRDINVKGPSHENGGVPKKLDEGDYVWSDHIKHQGKSMADWYAMFKDNPERVEQLRALQEQLAGRTPQMKDGGTVPKYQVGGYRLPTKTQPGFNMFGQYRDNPELGEGMKGVKVPKTYVAEVQAKPEVKAPVKKKGVPVPASERQTYIPMPPRDPQESQELPTAPESYANASAASLQPAPSATGEETRFNRFVKQYGAYGIPIAGAMAQLIANGTSEFGDVKVPKAPKITTEKQFLSRATSDAEEAAADRDYKAALDYAEKSGTGPAQQAAAQTAYEDKRSANERTRERTAEINIQQDAKEKGMNLEADLRTKMANAEFEAQRNATLYDRDMAKAEFNRNKGMNVGNIIAGAARDTMSYIGDERHAKAIYGKEGIQDRKYGYSEEMLWKNLKAMYPNKTNAEIQKLVDADRLKYQESRPQGTKA